MAGNEYPIAVCSHLTQDDEYHIWFTGRAKDRYWVCSACATQYPTLPDSLRKLPDTFPDGFRRGEEGICGMPEIRKRPTNLKFIHEQIELPISKVSKDNRHVDFQPNLGSDADWVALSNSGSIENFDPHTGDVRAVGYANPPFWIDENISLCVSLDLQYGAVYQTFGERAHVFHMRKNNTSIHVTRGTYCTKHTPFPIAFFQADGRTLLVVANDWNRLDVIDPATGSTLTERESNSAPCVDLETGHILTPEERRALEAAEKGPIHDFNSFRGQLFVSPNHQHILENGWVWHPCGVVRAWNLPNWIERNAWESDETPALRYLAQRNGHWHSSMCWIDNTRVAIWGWGDDDDFLIPAILVIDALTGEQTHWFAGPEVRIDRPPKKAGHSMFFDKYLFCVHDESGTGVWDVETGEHLHQEPLLKPIHYHPNSKQFLSRTPEGIQLSRISP